MKRLKGRVAVISGAASGLGRALARRSALEGMKVVLADTDKKGLAEVERSLKESGALVLPLVTDVSKVEDVELLAQKTLDHFGAVHLLCNTATVHCSKPLIKTTLTDWQRVAGVNLLGAIYCIAIFLPAIIKQNTEGHIVNIAPVLGGFYALPFNGPCNVSGFGVVNLSETLAVELSEKYPKIGISLIAPEYANMEAFGKRPHQTGALRNTGAEENDGGEIPYYKELLDIIRAAARAEVSPDTLAEIVFDAVRENKFYVFPHPSSRVLIADRLGRVNQMDNPAHIFQLLGVECES